MVIEAFREEVAKEGFPLQIARINISHQPIFGLIAPIDDFGLIGETLQRRHRTKNSSLMHRAHWLAPFWRIEILNHPDVCRTVLAERHATSARSPNLIIDNTGGQPVLHAHLIYPCAKDQQMLSSSS